MSDDIDRDERGVLSPHNPDGDRQKLLGSGSADGSQQQSDDDDDDDGYFSSRASPIPFADEAITFFRDSEQGSKRVTLAVAAVLLAVILLVMIPSPLRRVEDALPSLDRFAPSLSLVDLYSQMLRGCGGGACGDMLGWDNSSGTRVQSVVVEKSPYQIGSVVLGVGDGWEAARNAIKTRPAYEGTLLERYLNSRSSWKQHDVDFRLLGQLCRSVWKSHAPKEQLVAHFRNGDVDVLRAQQTVLQCARHFHSLRHISGQQKFPVRLVTAQMFSSPEADASAKDQADRAVSGLYAGLSTIGYEVRAQSSEDSDVDFCTLVQADDTCLSKGAFDSVVNAVRVALGKHSSQPNFEDIEGFLFQDYRQAAPLPGSSSAAGAAASPALHFSPLSISSESAAEAAALAAAELESKVYKFGESVMGLTGEMWKTLRKTIMHDPVYKGTLLQQYFKSKAPLTWIDGALFHDLCTKQWGVFAPREDVTIHQRSVKDHPDLVQCAAGIKRTILRTQPRKKQSLTARVVTTLNDAPVDSQVAKLVSGLENLGFTVKVQSSMSLLNAAAWIRDAAATLGFVLTKRGTISDDDSSEELFDEKLLQILLDAATGGEHQPLFRSNTSNPSKYSNEATAAAASSLEALVTAASDIDFCTLLQADRVCLATSSNFDKIIRVTQKQLTDQAAEAAANA